jgi:hypothetical protein
MSWWNKKCKYCGHEGLHLSDTKCPYNIGFTRGYDAGIKDRKESVTIKTIQIGDKPMKPLSDMSDAELLCYYGNHCAGLHLEYRCDITSEILHRMSAKQEPEKSDIEKMSNELLITAMVTAYEGWTKVDSKFNDIFRLQYADLRAELLRRLNK